MTGRRAPSTRRAVALAAAVAAAVTLAFAVPAPAAPGKKASKAEAAAPKPKGRDQDSVSADFIYYLLKGDRDSVALLFDTVSRPYVTQELVDRFQAQFKWLYDFVGGDFEPFMKGGSDSAWFREYRMSNETNKRYPLILIQTVFPDTVTPVMIGAQIKNFLGGKETPVAGEQVWKTGDSTYDLHAITATETGRGTMMVIAYHDPDTAQLTQETVAAKALPLIREALSRGYLDSARAALNPGDTLSDEIGVSFIRKDPRQGLTHVKISFSPADYGGTPAGKPPAKPGAKSKEKPAAKKAETKAPAKAPAKK